MSENRGALKARMLNPIAETTFKPMLHASELSERRLDDLLRPELAQELRAYAAMEGVSVEGVIREAVTAYLHGDLG